MLAEQRLERRVAGHARFDHLRFGPQEYVRARRGRGRRLSLAPGHEHDHAGCGRQVATDGRIECNHTAIPAALRSSLLVSRPGIRAASGAGSHLAPLLWRVSTSAKTSLFTDGFPSVMSGRAPESGPRTAGSGSERTARSEPMAKYKIAWLPGDGIGVDVLEAARMVLDRVELDAEDIDGDIGWEFWCREGDAFPQRTIDLLRTVDAALFSAPLPRSRSRRPKRSLYPPCAAPGSLPLPDRPHAPAVRSVRLAAPLQGLPGQSAELTRTTSIWSCSARTPRTWTQALSSTRCRRRLASVLARLSTPFAPFANLPGDQYAVSCKIRRARVPSASSAPRSSSARASAQGHDRPQGRRRSRDRRLLPRNRTRRRASIPRDRDGRRECRRDHDVAAEEPVQLRRAASRQPVWRHRLGSLRADGRRARLRLLGQHRREARRVRADARVRAEVRGATR